MTRWAARMTRGGLLLTRARANDAIGAPIDAAASPFDAPRTGNDANRRSNDAAASQETKNRRFRSCHERRTKKRRLL
ncbi:hypothetical protein [Alkalicoccus urumqiensis]|uniref:hypothetical protein n=1 Tax=Alkalicoccus urumqiensis TaxID=1548213 RepID=UPI0015E60E31|nr:hypothetical protein [Alkalicoccus urumqiensis]